MKREPCRYCRLPLATERDVASAYAEPGLCWSIVDYCDTDAETAIDMHLATIAQLERELADARSALMLAAQWGISSDGFSAEVSSAIRCWIINGMKGPPPEAPARYKKRDNLEGPGPTEQERRDNARAI